MRKKIFYAILTVTVLLAGAGGFLVYQALMSPKSSPSGNDGFNNVFKQGLSENDRFRNSVITFIEEIAVSHFNEEAVGYPEKLKIPGTWKAEITLYYNGAIKGEGAAEKEVLSQAVESATIASLDDDRARALKEGDIGKIQFLVQLTTPSKEHLSFIGSNGKGIEILDVKNSIVAVRSLTKDILREKINQGKEFLLSIENPQEHGFYKYYHVLEEEKLEPRLHTVYSASIIYTLLYVYEFDKDERILEKLSDWADFLLKMQNRNKDDKYYGAFSYSYYLDTREKEKKYVIGTSALSIFTLLRLYEYTGEEKYLDSAKLAGDWLLTMQNDDGTMNPYVRYRDGRWYHGTKESFLYEGQTLSSLSKLYQATGEKKYYEAAKKIAERFASKIEEAGGEYIVDEYRALNPISNSWPVMSLMDFYKATGEKEFKDIVFQHSQKVLENQYNDPSDLENYGRWKDAYSTSGNGWIGEVMAETYRLCLKEGRDDCEKYKTAVIKVIRWIIQHTYSEDNTFYLENPDEVIGGIFWDKNDKYIRTDSICHGVNGYVRMMDYLPEGTLLFVQEPVLEKISEFFE